MGELVLWVDMGKLWWSSAAAACAAAIAAAETAAPPGHGAIHTIATTLHAGENEANVQWLLDAYP